MYPDRIILHHSLTKDNKTVSWNAIRKYHMGKGWKDIGYHFGIELIGERYEILMGRLMDKPGAHTKGQNGKAIGICILGNFDEIAPIQAQWDLAIALVSSLRHTFMLGLNDIYGHRDFASYKSCPGKAFDMKKFRSEIT